MLKDFFKRTQNIAIEPKKIFPRKKKIIHEINTEQKNKVPDGTWVKCDKCSKMLYKQDIDLNLLVCPECGKHYRMPAYGRIASVIDNESFVEYDKSMQSVNPINFPEYEQKLESLQKKTGLCEAVVTGKGKINGMETFICVMDSRFLMGSMGSVVGEKITRIIEKAIQSKLPIIIFTASGGARMQEGIISLMQMAKVSAALSRHNAAGLLSLIVLTDPTTGGVTASFAMLGDIILSEPEALIGFAGQRVIEQTIKQKLPDGFQSAEFLFEHGFIDKIVQRKDLKNTLSNILKLHMGA